MRNTLKFGLAAALASLMLASDANAQANNDPPPAGPVVLNLDGTPIPHTYQAYTTNEFVATTAVTNISFALREDPAFLFLDDVTMRDVTTNTAVTVVNGGFESGPVGASAPTGWTYLNIFGATFGGQVEDEGAHTGSNAYVDGAVQAYDAITQGVSTTVGDVYTISFWLNDDSSNTTFSALSTNGEPGTGGNGINLVVYGGAGLPTPAPEPASLVMLGTGLAFVGIVYGKRRKLA